MDENYMVSNYIDFDCFAYPKGPELIQVSSQHDDLTSDLKMDNPVRLHSHKFTEIMLLVQGAAHFVYNTKTYEIKKGDLVVISPGIQHLEKWNEEFTFYTIGVLNLHLPANCNHFIFQTGAYFDTYRFYFHMLMNEVRIKAYNYQKMMKNIFMNICILLRRDITGITVNRREGPETTQNAAALAKDYIEANYSQNITLKMLSHLTYLSPQYLIRQFRALTGYSPHQYLIRVRIQAAASDLVQRRNTIRQISEQAGFKNTHTFICAFKKLIGMTPHDFREKYELSPAEGMKAVRLMKFKNDMFLVSSFKE